MHALNVNHNIVCDLIGKMCAYCKLSSVSAKEREIFEFCERFLKTIYLADTVLIYARFSPKYSGWIVTL